MHPGLFPVSLAGLKTILAVGLTKNSHFPWLHLVCWTAFWNFSQQRVSVEGSLCYRKWEEEEGTMLVTYPCLWSIQNLFCHQSVETGEFNFTLKPSKTFTVCFYQSHFIELALDCLNRTIYTPQRKKISNKWHFKSEHYTLWTSFYFLLTQVAPFMVAELLKHHYPEICI